MLSLVKESVLTFARLPYSICCGYKIITIENVNGKDVQSEEYIDNPKVPLMVYERMELEYNDRHKWDLPKYATTTSTDSLKVWVNNIELDIDGYTYSSSLKMLTINQNINVNDLIEIEYAVDRIEIKRKSQNEINFKVYPIFNESHKIGQHSVI